MVRTFLTLLLFIGFTNLSGQKSVINIQLPKNKFFNDSVNFQKLYETANQCLNENDRNKSKTLFNQLYYQIIGDSLHPAINQIILLSNMFYNSGEIYRAIKLYKIAVREAEQKGDTINLIKYSAWLGYLYTLDRDYAESFTILSNNLNLLEKINNRELLSRVHLFLGFNFRDQGKTEKAKYHFRQALYYADSAGFSENTHVSLNELGNLYTLDSNYVKALEYLFAALKIRTEKNLNMYLGFSYNDIGVAYLKMKQYNKALEYFFKAAEIADKENNLWDKQRYYLNIGEVYILLDKFNEAEKYIEEAKKMAIQSGQNSLMPEIYNKLTQIEKTKNNYKRALYYSELEKLYRDSVINTETVKKIAELESRFEVERKENQLRIQKQQLENAKLEAKQTIYQRNVLIIAVVLILFVVLLLFINIRQKIIDNKVIESQKAEIAKIAQGLAESNAAKDKFFSIIAHDLRNPFNVIMGFSELLILKAHNFDKDEMVNISSLINQSAKNTYQLLENLLIWAKSQKGGLVFSPQIILLKEELNNELSELGMIANNKEILFQNEIPDHFKVYADLNMIKTIIRNLISNAIKFTPRGGKITLSAVHSNGSAVITVQNSGKGMDNITISKLFKISESFSTSGTEDEKGTGLGLILCHEFVQQHRGRIWVESKPDQGSTFYFSIPDKKSDK